MVNLKWRIAKKLCRITLPHFGLVTFLSHVGKTRQLLIVMVFWISGRVHDSQNQLFLLWETTNIRIISRKDPEPFSCFRKSQGFGNPKMLEVGKDGGRRIPAIRLIHSCKSWIFDQHLRKNMKWKFGNIGSISSKKILNVFESLKLRDQDTKELWTFEISLFNYEIHLPLNIPTPIPAPAHLLGDTRELGGHDVFLCISYNRVVLFMRYWDVYVKMSRFCPPACWRPPVGPHWCIARAQSRPPELFVLFRTTPALFHLFSSIIH